MKVKKEQIEAAYDMAKRVFANEMPVMRGAELLHSEHGLNKTSARHFIEDYRLLRQGDVYTRTLSVPAVDVFLDRIFADDGAEGLAVAIAAIRKHIVYYEKKRAITLKSLPKTVDRHEQRLFQPESLELVQKRLAEAIERALVDDPEARRERLRRASKKPATATVTTQVYLRNADVVAEVLSIAKGMCQICGKAAPFNRRNSGAPYLEVHHRVQLAHGGDDSVENAIGICPNCHRESHFGVQLGSP